MGVSLGVLYQADEAGLPVLHITTEVAAHFSIQWHLQPSCKCRMPSSDPFCGRCAAAALLLPHSTLMTAAHANGARQYDTHNLFGTSMAMNHHTAFKAVVGKRPFLLSR